jgi:putative transcriptional regulator
MMRDEKLSPAGAEIVGALTEFRDALREGSRAVAKKFTVRTVELKVKPQLYSGKDVESVRRMLGLSQALFAQFLGVSPHAVRAWENGGKTPSGVVRRFLDEICVHPDYWKDRLRQLIVSRSKGPKQATPDGESACGDPSIQPRPSRAAAASVPGASNSQGAAVQPGSPIMHPQVRRPRSSGTRPRSRRGTGSHRDEV